MAGDVLQRRCGLLAVAALVALLVLASSASADYSPASEAQNYSKINERYQYESGTASYQALLTQRGAESEVELAQIAASDPERNPFANLCVHHGNGCAGDVRLYHWSDSGYGISRPVLFTNRAGATI